MSVDLATVKRVAHLARIALSEEEAQRMCGELNVILDLGEQLDEVDVTGVEAMTSVMPMTLYMREDVVSDGDRQADIIANAPLSEENFFLVPKVVE
ncbi:MAG: Aspartyl/glutamyl-tRNA(Asn/Gln) amidotransferase subunit C [Candidatus Tokpelaia hoelldobleri]|uniref:Aspartyl/glutamyl-tRNA(Asn/Gln) amidotransferase subunit C n=1 Tax=Candidatus Tokpelaia hoelldobleri TaxID=1902579 RepID=A0A1U9JU54_9HYPH|nr:MAG: Aspartyl/glutamyl-tRNA(Asn/Gln) amidotransferase subunit C [Candidatus Tokpelaia hoelldoblerii]